jgi:GTP-binding protein YchF
MLRAGIVGLPNVGKSTLFNAIADNAKAEAANFPFCTIEPNTGLVSVPDERMEKLQKIVNTKVVIPTRIEFVDIAGLVRGASQGEGLGNQFLSHIRQVDAIVHVVRCFEDPNITHVEGSIDPERDISTINLELALSDLAQIEKRQQKITKQARTDKVYQEELKVLERLTEALDQGTPARLVTLTAEEQELLNNSNLGLLTSKPVIYAANVSETDLATGNAFVDRVKAIAEKEHAGVVVMSAQVESELVELPPEDRKDFLASLGVEEGGLQSLIRATYSLLDLITYFTAGEKEVRAWTIRRGTLAPQAAGVIHSDFEKGFIRSETISYKDLVAAGSYAAAREKGTYRSEGKEYLVKDGDVLHFRFNV